jgi:hypothetical protein
VIGFYFSDIEPPEIQSVEVAVYKCCAFTAKNEESWKTVSSYSHLLTE